MGIDLCPQESVDENARIPVIQDKSDDEKDDSLFLLHAHTKVG